MRSCSVAVFRSNLSDSDMLIAEGVAAGVSSGRAVADSSGVIAMGAGVAMGRPSDGSDCKALTVSVVSSVDSKEGREEPSETIWVSLVLKSGSFGVGVGSAELGTSAGVAKASGGGVGVSVALGEPTASINRLLMGYAGVGEERPILPVVGKLSLGCIDSERFTVGFFTIAVGPSMKADSGGTAGA